MSGLKDCIAATADQIRAAIDTVDGLAVQVEPRRMLAPTPLTIDIYPAPLMRDTETAAFAEISGGYVLTVRARTNTPDWDAAYDILIGLMDDEDPLSLPAALYDEPTLNGTAASIDIRDFTGMQGYQEFPGQDSYLGCQWTLLIIPTKS